MIASALWLAAVITAWEDKAPLELADLAEYRAALEPNAKDAPISVGFLDLWEHPERLRKRRVRIEGRIVRRFHQPAAGTFPALVEAWATTTRGNLFCLVYPDGKDAGKVVPDAPVNFTGTYLKQIQYQAQDGRRLAPLIVGPGPPVSPPTAKERSSAASPVFSRLDWLMATAVGGIVVIVLLRLHLRRPAALGAWEYGPPPTFMSDEGHEDRDHGR